MSCEHTTADRMTEAKCSVCLVAALQAARAWVLPQTRGCRHTAGDACEHDYATGLLRQIDRALKS